MSNKDAISVEFKWLPIVENFENKARVRQVLAAKFRVAAETVGTVLEGKMRKRIRDGGFEPNAPMTVTLKGASKPLVGRPPGRFFKAITHKVRQASSNAVVIDVGVMRTHKLANVAEILAKGRSITVTARMAIMFRVLRSIQLGRGGAATSERAKQLLNSSRGQIPTLKVGTVLVIPPRDIGLAVLRDAETPKILQNEFNRALAEAFKALKAGGP